MRNMDTTTTQTIEYGLLLDISDYVEDPIEGDVDIALHRIYNETYDMIPSFSNIEGWEQKLDNLIRNTKKNKPHTPR